MADLEFIEVDVPTKPGLTLSFPEATNNRNGFVRIVGMDAKRYTNDKSTAYTTPIFEFPLPLEGLKYTDGMSYENQNFGIIRNMIIDGGVDISQTASDVVDTFKNAGDASVRRNAIASITAMMGVGIGQVKSRTTPNPNTRSVFKSPNLREFSFTWKLNPISSSEANTLKAMIKMLRAEMYPKRMFPKQETRIGYKYPSIWRIEVFIGNETGKENQVEPFIKPCWLVNVNTEMGANAAVLGKSGKDLNFAETTISMRFQEEIALTSEDVLEGF